ncbi:MAG: glycosyltransferase [Bacteroidetes bacterium]|nr:glycosyltransferase [Bacteroidota bacterium]MBS1629810.1 glycosyltransferase [Bacteroidota bacterium]
MRGGLADFDERFARALQSLGHELSLYSYSLQYPSFLFPGKTQRTDAAAPEGLRILPLINSIHPLNWIKAGRRIRDERPDLLIVRYWMPFFGPALGTILRIVAKNKHTRILCIADNILPHEKRPGDAAFTRYFMKPVHAFVTMSEEVNQDLLRLTNKASLRLQHPLYDNYGSPIPKDEARNRLGLPAAGKYVLFFGFIRKYKGLDLLLEALAQPLLATTDVRLIIAGEYYGDEDFYEGIIARHKLEKRVHRFTDFIPNDEVKLYFSAADCVALPYRSATQSGITQVAIQFGKGMVATRVGGLPEMVDEGKTGLLCAPEPAALAQALFDFFKPGSLPELDLHLARLRQELSWTHFAEALLTFVQGLPA